MLSGPLSAFGINRPYGLAQLFLGRNRFTGTLDVLAGWKSYLTAIDLSHNLFTGTLFGLTNFTTIIQLNVGYNQLSGSLQYLSPLNSGYMTQLFLNNNQFSGPAIPYLLPLIKITSIDISSNPFNDVLSTLDMFSQLPKLTLLQASNTKWSGSGLSINFVNMSQLALLNLSGNSGFEGDLVISTDSQTDTIFDIHGVAFDCPMPIFPSTMLPIVSSCHENFNGVGQILGVVAGASLLKFSMLKVDYYFFLFFLAYLASCSVSISRSWCILWGYCVVLENLRKPHRAQMCGFRGVGRCLFHVDKQCPIFG
jgi:hypothetical protein